MNQISGTKIEKILLESGVINREQLEQVKSLQDRTGQDLESVLISEGIIKQKELLSLVAVSMGVEAADLETVEVNHAAIHKVNGEIAVKYHIFPFDIKNNLLYLAMKNPDDLFTIDEIKVFTQMEIKPFLADPRSIGKAIFRFYGMEVKPEPGTTKVRYSKSEAGRNKKVSSIISRSTQPAKTNGSPVNSALGHSPGSEDRNEEGLDELVKRVIAHSLKAEYVSDVYMDPIHRNVTVTLTFKY